MTSHSLTLNFRRWTSSVVIASSVVVAAGALLTSPAGATGVCTPGAPASAEPKVTFDNSFSSDGLIAQTSTVRLDTEIVQGPNNSAFVALRSSDGTFGDYHDIYKYLPDGSLDTTWGTNGVAFINMFPSGQSETLDALVAMPDGGLAALLHTSNTMDGRVLKLNATGSRDNAFGSLGVASFTSGLIAGGLGLARGTSGALYYGHWSAGQHKISKVDATGTLDNAFGTNGVINVRNAKNFVTDSAGAIYVGGQTIGTGSMYPQGNNSSEISKFLANGSLDTSFGSNGQVTVNAATNTEYHGALTFQNDELTGMIFAGTTEFSASVAAVYRMSTTGVMSPTFGTSGIKSFSDITGSNGDPTRPRATVFADGSTIFTVPGLGQQAVTELTALAPNGDVVASRFRLQAGDCNMRIVVLFATANGIYAAARHQPDSQQPDSTPYIFKFSVTGVPAPTTTTTTPTTIAPTTTVAASPSTTVAAVTPAAASTTTLPAPALAVVRGLPVATKPLVTDTSIATGEKVSVTFSGFRPFEFVQLIVASTPRVIGSGTANAQGVVTLQGNLPENLGAGAHTLAVFAPASGIGFTQKITVSAATLPATGSRQSNLLVLAVAMFGLGLLLRRTSKSQVSM